MIGSRLICQSNAVRLVLAAKAVYATVLPVESRMENPRLFVIAALAILCVPGPTNTLLATGGASVGVKRALHLLLGEGGGYLVAILTIGLALRPLIAGSPLVSLVLRLLVGGYLTTVAWSLWRRGVTSTEAAGRRIIRLRNVFVTTLFNPKALVVALGIIPFGARHPEYHLAGFLFLTAAAGTGWIVTGAMLGGAARAAGRATLVPCIGALAIGAFAIVLVVGPLLR